MFVILTSSLFAAFLSAIQFTQSAPVKPPVTADPYNCGYVRTRYNSSVVAGIFALETCMPFYYNESIGNYQDAFAYTLYGGCTCRFYSNEQDCRVNTSVPEYRGSTDRWHEPLFLEPRPAWYNCYEQE